MDNPESDLVDMSGTMIARLQAFQRGKLRLNAKELDDLRLLRLLVDGVVERREPDGERP